MGDLEPPKLPQVVENRPHFQALSGFWELFGAQVVDSLPLFGKCGSFAHIFRKRGRVSTTNRKLRLASGWSYPTTLAPDHENLPPLSLLVGETLPFRALW